METNKLKSKTQKVANAMIIGMVIVGTVIFALINQVSSGVELMPKLFLIFFGAIITVQVIPGLIPPCVRIVVASLPKFCVNLGA